jgi:hypothetical protein
VVSVGAATTPKGEGWKKLRRKGRMAAADGADAPGTPRSPTVYDWCVPQPVSKRRLHLLPVPKTPKCI